MTLCKKCAKELEHDEIAIYKRMVDRGASEFLCVKCMAEYFGVTEELIREKIEHFRRQGCTLFSS
ncbi:MAG: hypothetical protein VB118_11870 [Oscillospiraceae bacterium]|nr:hypothetical protein [Oscillospiraceae bacterium]